MDFTHFCMLLRHVIELRMWDEEALLDYLGECSVILGSLGSVGGRQESQSQRRRCDDRGSGQHA